MERNHEIFCYRKFIF